MAMTQPDRMWGIPLRVVTRLGAPPVVMGGTATAVACAWPSPPLSSSTPVSGSNTSAIPSVSLSANVAWRDETFTTASSVGRPPVGTPPAVPPTRLPSPAALLTSVRRKTGSIGGRGVDRGCIGKASWVRDRRMNVASLLSPAESPPVPRPAIPEYLPATAAGAARADGHAARTAAKEELPRTSDSGALLSPPPGGTTRTRCTVCSKVLSSRTNMLRHVRVVHERSQVLRCDRCPSAFLYACQLKLHVATVHHKRRPFPCGVCGRGFGTRGHAKEHLQLVHEKRRPFGCGKCDKRCRTRALLAAHVRAAHGGEDGAKSSKEMVRSADPPVPGVACSPVADVARPMPPPPVRANGRAPETEGIASVWGTATLSYEMAMQAPIASR